MAFTLIIGPMKCGKSLELIARAAPYEVAGQKVIYVQPKVDVRDGQITSRIGLSAKSNKVKSLSEINSKFDVLAVDEIHMFKPADVTLIKKWVKQGKTIFVSGLDLAYTGKMQPIIIKLLELKPDEIVTKLAVCDVCNSYSARFSQILCKGELVLGGMPPVVPEDGTYEYQARCRNCFVQAK